jgi:L-fuconate dehydratase
MSEWSPIVGDKGQIHQRLVLVDHIATGHERVFLEHIPHLRDRFVYPAGLSADIT